MLYDVTCQYTNVTIFIFEIIWSSFEISIFVIILIPKPFSTFTEMCLWKWLSEAYPSTILTSECETWLITNFCKNQSSIDAIKVPFLFHLLSFHLILQIIQGYKESNLTLNTKMLLTNVTFAHVTSWVMIDSFMRYVTYCLQN